MQIQNAPIGSMNVNKLLGEPVSNRSSSHFSTNRLTHSGNNPSENVETSINQLSQQLSQQLQKPNDTDNRVALSNSTIEGFSFEDSNNDGVLNAGDNIVITYSDESGAQQQLKIPLTEEGSALLQDFNNSNSIENSPVYQAVIKLFIEQMKLDIINQGKEMRDYISKSSPDFSL